MCIIMRTLYYYTCIITWVFNFILAQEFEARIFIHRIARYLFYRYLFALSRSLKNI